MNEDLQERVRLPWRHIEQILTMWVHFCGTPGTLSITKNFGLIIQSQVEVEGLYTLRLEKTLTLR